MRYNKNKHPSWILRAWMIVFLLLFSLNRSTFLGVSAKNVYGSQYTWIYRCNRLAEKSVALTFDDGPHPTLTAEILEILKEYDIPATFFVVGENAKRYPSIVRRILADGHELGNHTYSHIRSDKVEKNVFEREILSCTETIHEITRQAPTLFRPPEGAINDNLRDLCKELDYRIVLWSIDTEDWRHTPPEEIVSRVIREVKGGDIILMHDYIGKGSPTPAALKKIIPALIARGYRFVLVSELLNIGADPTESEVNR